MIITVTAWVWCMAIPIHLYLGMYHDASPAYLGAHGIVGLVMCWLILIDDWAAMPALIEREDLGRPS